MKNKLTYQDVLDETIEYYNTNPRGYDAENSKCVYLGPNGEMCAVGRCLVDPSEFDSTVSASGIIEQNGMKIFKEKYRHLNNRFFWDRLQIFHDEEFPNDYLIRIKEFIENEQSNS